MNAFRLKRLLLTCACIVMAAMPLANIQAQTLTLAPGSPDTYVVKEGDTLWDIASVFLQEPWRWPEIWQGNPEVQDPDLIYPGDVLQLVATADGPRILLERAGRQVVRLSPTVRESPLLNPIPTLPRQALQGFLVENRIVDKETFESAPYILSSATGNLIMGAGHEVFVRGEWPGTETGFDVFRLGATYRDDEGELIGQEAIKLGELTVISDEGDGLRRALIVQSDEELKASDRLLPREADRLDLNYFPRSPDVALDGSIIGLLNNESQAAQYESVVIDLGLANGLNEGDLLSILRKGNVVEDVVARTSVTLPATEIGLLLVYKTFERMSYGVILTLIEPSAAGDFVRTP
jgi:hypothetical protein